MEVNKRIEFSKFKAQVVVDEGSNRVIVQILSKDSGEVIRQIRRFVRKEEPECRPVRLSEIVKNVTLIKFKDI